MPQPTMMYVLSHILNNIPPQLLELAFKPQQYNTTVEQRIVSQVIEGPVLLDTNLVGGKPRQILMQNRWLMDLPHAESYGILGIGTEASSYMIPPEAREGRNISSVLSVIAFAGGAMAGAGVNFNGMGYGLTATNLLSDMLGTHTMRNNSVMPSVTLEGNNIIKFFPELLTDGLAINVMLEQDSEFLNMNASGIFALRELALCATQRYIGNNLVVPVDETEIVAGMEIGVIKTLVQDCKTAGERYGELLIKLKGALHTDPASIRRLIYYSL